MNSYGRRSRTTLSPWLELNVKTWQLLLLAIAECEVIEMKKKNESEKPKFEKILENDAMMIIEIVRIFKKNSIKEF